jgi:uncharacterized membrane protein YfcA
VKRKRRDWRTAGILMLVAVASSASGAYLAVKYATPCVCLVAVQRGITN